MDKCAKIWLENGLEYRDIDEPVGRKMSFKFSDMLQVIWYYFSITLILILSLSVTP